MEKENNKRLVKVFVPLMVIGTLATCLFFVLVAISTADGATWSVYDDFNITSNPNGPYSYGWEASLGGQFFLYDKTHYRTLLPAH